MVNVLKQLPLSRLPCLITNKQDVMKLTSYLFIAMILFYCSKVSGQTVKRGRNEGTFNIPASNVPGNGNINLGTVLNTNYNETGFSIDPGVSISVGFAHILQFCGKITFPEFRTLGCTEGRIQLTTPFNNNLRFFGFALTGNIYLSTEEDTINKTAFSGRPEYNAHIRPSLTIDLDWISLFKNIPLKTYFHFNMAEKPDSLFRYEQLSFILGTEWKTYQHSIFIDLGTGMFKEKKSSRFKGDARYRQKRFWIEPGIRYRIRKKFSLLGSLRILLYQNVKANNPLSADYLRFSAALELPVIFRETNSEAIRTMLFVKNAKQARKDLISETINQNKKFKTDLEMIFDEFDKDFKEPEDKKSITEKRMEIQQKMKDIENLLKELE